MTYPSGPPTAFDSLTVAGVPTLGTGGAPFSPFGHWWFINTVTGSDGNPGTADAPFATMARAMVFVADNDVISFIGKIREQIVAPLGVTGVRILGVPGGNVRDDDGAKWYAPASPVAGQALIEIREQGWEFHNFLMTPDTTSGACIKAHRNEDATYPDSSHFICNRMRFVGTSGTQYGVQDVGGNHHYLITDCEFQSLTFGLYCSSTSIAVPLRNVIRNSRFYLNTNDLASSQNYAIIERNHFMTAGSGATNKVISTTYNAVQGGNNHVFLNQFSNTEAQIAPGSGYTGAASDTWMNYVNDQAALAYGQPA